MTREDGRMTIIFGQIHQLSQEHGFGKLRIAGRADIGTDERAEPRQRLG